MKTPEPVTLEGRFVRLEPLEARHPEGLAAAGAEDPDLFRFMTLNPITSGWETWYAEAMAGQASHYLPWATVLASDGRPIGSTRFGDIEPAHDRVEIGWTWLGQSGAEGSRVDSREAIELRLDRCEKLCQAGRLYESGTQHDLHVGLVESVVPLDLGERPCIRVEVADREVAFGADERASLAPAGGLGDEVERRSQLRVDVQPILQVAGALRPRPSSYSSRSGRRPRSTRGAPCSGCDGGLGRS